MKNESADLSIKGESIQSLYGSFLSKSFLVNRRYQRKLVWTIDEKRSFIDSIVKGYPVPLILLVEVNSEKGKKLEIIDGMQRMNAMMSFIEQEFDINNGYFDLDTMADTKLLKDEGILIQKTDVLDRSVCANIVRYTIPLSIFQEAGSSHVDEVFRRLNSGGRHLSRQELRQAGTTSKFASIVRKISSNIRGDSSVSDILDLNSMKKISITNKNLDYGIAIDNIFWIENNIINKDDLRKSKDEEIIADITAWVSIDKGTRSSSDILDQLYGYRSNNFIKNDISDYNDDVNLSLFEQIETQIQKIDEEVIIINVQYVFDELIKLVRDSGKPFNSLLFKSKQSRVPRYFQIVFLSLYKLLINDGLDIFNRDKLISLLEHAGDKTINLSSGGGNWSVKEKQTQIDAFCGVISSCFERSESKDPSRNQWVTRFENLLMQSSTEQVLYDFKTGLHELTEHNEKFDEKTFSKIIKTLTAMANTFPGSNGYCLIGVADNKQTADRHKSIYKENYISYSNFFVTGIDSEAEKFYGDTDKYFIKLTQLVKSEPISDRDKDNISRNISTVKYFNKTIIILKIESDRNPSIYDSKYYVRHGNSVDEVKPKDFVYLFQRFNKK